MLQRALARLAIENLQVNGDRISLQCRRSAKMSVLEALTSMGGRIVDIHVREPSLEDIFLGYSD